MNKFEFTKAVLEHPSYGGGIAAGDPIMAEVITAAGKSVDHLASALWVASVAVAVGGPESLRKFLDGVRRMNSVMPTPEELELVKV